MVRYRYGKVQIWLGTDMVRYRYGKVQIWFKTMVQTDKVNIYVNWANPFTSYRPCNSCFPELCVPFY